MRKQQWNIRNLICYLFFGWIIISSPFTNYAMASNKDTSSTESGTSNTKRVNTKTNSTEVVEEDVRDDLSTIVLSDPKKQKTANTLKPTIPATTYQYYFPFQDTKTLKGIFSSEEMFLYVPEYWETKVIYACIEYNLSQLLSDEVPASLTFLLNEEAVYSCKVLYDTGETQLMYVPIPVETLKIGYNRLEIVAYARIFDYEGCSEDQSWANWIHINTNSYVYVGYELKDHNNKINQYPYPFLSTVNPTGKGTTILVSDQGDNGELTAAMQLLADLSESTVNKNEISLRYYGESRGEATNKIIITLTKNIPENLNSYLYLNDAGQSGNQRVDLSKRAMVRFVNDTNGEPILLIVSDQAENLMEAVHMLMDEDRLIQENVSTTFVQEGSAALITEARKLNQMIAGKYTIEDIMGRGITYLGPFHSEAVLYLPFPNDYTLSSAGKITLKFRYSDNLDFSRSLMTVYWGDIPVASKKLSKENAGEDELTFTMPADVVGSNASSIKIAFDLEIKDLICTMRQDEMPWAYIRSDSTLYLPSQESTYLSFDTIPSPYQSNGNFSDVLVITSDRPDSTELELLGKTVALYGANVNAYGSIKVIRSSEFNEKYHDYNIITAGKYQTNRFIQTINSQLHFKYSDLGDQFQSNSKLVLADHYARSIATFQLLASPYGLNRALLVVGGTNTDTLNLALQFINAKEKQIELTGDCVLLDSEMNTMSFEFIKKQIAVKKPTVGEYLEKNKQPLMFTLLSTSAMVMILTASVIILIRTRRLKKNEEHTQ